MSLYASCNELVCLYADSSKADSKEQTLAEGPIVQKGAADQALPSNEDQSAPTTSNMDHADGKANGSSSHAAHLEQDPVDNASAESSMPKPLLQPKEGQARSDLEEFRNVTPVKDASSLVRKPRVKEVEHEGVNIRLGEKYDAPE